jgi:anthranilate/para-aminobenzoate synthase component I
LDAFSCPRQRLLTPTSDAPNRIIRNRRPPSATRVPEKLAHFDVRTRSMSFLGHKFYRQFFLYIVSTIKTCFDLELFKLLLFIQKKGESNLEANHLWLNMNRLRVYSAAALRRAMAMKTLNRTGAVSAQTVLNFQSVQVRHFDARKKRKTKRQKDPFKIFGIPEASLYKDAKKKFLQIAMKNHPDTHNEDMTEEEKDEMQEIFINSRIAFKALVEDSDGTAILVEDAEDAMENFDSWFKSETGLDTPFQFDLDPETMKEVAKMTEEIGGDVGMDRDGGMWALARMVTSAVKAGGDAATMLRLDAGDSKERDRRINGGLRRRRRR